MRIGEWVWVRPCAGSVPKPGPQGKPDLNAKVGGGGTRFSGDIEFLHRNLVLQCGMETQQTAEIVVVPPPEKMVAPLTAGRDEASVRLLVDRCRGLWNLGEIGTKIGVGRAHQVSELDRLQIKITW